MPTCADCRRSIVVMGRRILNGIMGAAYGAWRGLEALRQLDDAAEAYHLSEAHANLRASLKDAEVAWADRAIDAEEYARWQHKARSAARHIRDLLYYDEYENNAHAVAAQALTDVRDELRPASRTVDRALATAEYRQGGAKAIADLIGERGEA